MKHDDQPTSARMAGKVTPSWCPVCRSKPGPDCPDIGRTKRQVKAAEKRAWKA